MDTGLETGLASYRGCQAKPVTDHARPAAPAPRVPGPDRTGSDPPERPSPGPQTGRLEPPPTPPTQADAERAPRARVPARARPRAAFRSTMLVGGCSGSPAGGIRPKAAAASRSRPPHHACQALGRTVPEPSPTPAKKPPENHHRARAAPPKTPPTQAAVEREPRARWRARVDNRLSGRVIERPAHAAAGLEGGPTRRPRVGRDNNRTTRARHRPRQRPPDSPLEPPDRSQTR